MTQEINAAKNIFNKEVAIIHSFLLGVEAVSSPVVAGNIRNIRENNLRWLDDAMCNYAAVYAAFHIKEQNSTLIKE